MKINILRVVLIISFISLLFTLNGCTGISTFPTVARAGDTVSVMVGGTEKSRKETIEVTLTDVNGLEWDLKALGLVRSVFNLRADGRAAGNHYSPYFDSFISWDFRHEPLQTVLVVNMPTSVPAGDAVMTVNTNVNDDSSGVLSPFSIDIEIIPGLGNADNFNRQDAFGGEPAVDFRRLEPAPYAKIDFGNRDNIVIGAASLIIDFDETVVNSDDINIYVPESTVRGSFVATGSFGDKQRMVYWHQNGQQLFIDVIAPQGISQTFLLMYIVHPHGLSASPSFNLTSSKVYDINGDEISLFPTLEYFP